MADPKKKVRFVSADPDKPVQEVSGVNSLTGEQVSVKFTNGSFETSDPGLIPWLQALASDPAHPFQESRKEK